MCKRALRESLEDQNEESSRLDKLEKEVANLKRKLSTLKFPVEQDDLRLRHWENKDVPSVVSASHDPYIPMVTSIPKNCDVAGAKQWLERQFKKVSLGTDLSLCIADLKNDRALGMIGLFGLDDANDRARCGYWIVPDCRGHNYSGKALSMISRLAFDSLSIARLELFIEPSNVASVHAAKFADYLYDRTMPSCSEIGGSIRDMMVFVRMPK